MVSKRKFNKDYFKKDKQREIWVKSTAFGKIYDVKNLPSDQILIQDLKNMLKIYDRVVAKGGTSEVLKNQI